MTVKNKILLFGNRVYGERKPKILIDYYSVESLEFPAEYQLLNSLSDYFLVILDYAGFVDQRNVYSKEQDVFLKLIQEALNKGTHFCILHYDESVPKQDHYNPDDGDMDKEDIKKCSAYQIGFRLLYGYQIRPLQGDQPILRGNLCRNEFEQYFSKWGTSKNAFVTYRDGEFDDILYALNSSEQFVLAFVSERASGKVVYMPCQRDYKRPQSIHESLEVLINSLITYLKRSEIVIPEWAATPLFPNEEKLRISLSQLDTEINELKAKVAPYQQAKELVFLAEYKFENALPSFFESYFSIPTFREEKFREDFWLLNEKSERIAIVEAKTHSRGLKKSDIYALYNHRESHKLDESFPAILVVNLHLNASSWKEKEKVIPPQECRLAVENSILIIKIEDLLRVWNGVQEDHINYDEFVGNLLSQHGWMEVLSDGKIKIHK